MRLWTPAITMRTTPVTRIISVAARPERAPPLGHVFGADEPHRDIVVQHGLLQWDQGIAGEDQVVVVFKEVTRLLDEQLLGPMEESQVIRPPH
jgi:hypothetical protein